jgi:hypothetical protein
MVCHGASTKEKQNLSSCWLNAGEFLVVDAGPRPYSGARTCVGGRAWVGRPTPGAEKSGDEVGDASQT